MLLIMVISLNDGLPVEYEEQSPENNEELFEGDIVIDKSNQFQVEKNGFLGEHRRWNKNVFGFVSVPFVMSSDYSEFYNIYSKFQMMKNFKFHLSSSHSKRRKRAYKVSFEGN